MDKEAADKDFKILIATIALSLRTALWSLADMLR